MSGWGRELATIWTNNVAPSRPSNSEMCVYTKYLRQLQETFRRRIKILDQHLSFAIGGMKKT